ncbi:MAG: helix-turn-helix domain-containing protein, partial [Candidatus Adiutrix sp.]|nr:helix-turn-helix domain-containing protein [Candidatus Adiutrix sp.]
RVRLPNEPLMFVDRVLSIEGQPLSMTSGRIVTEHDILPDAWYLDNGYMPAGLAIESGQADLMLSAWLGADFSTRGLALYRLLDAEVFFHRPFMPKAGETARYDIRIVRFFKYGQTHLFRFEFQGTIGGRPLLTMKGGCAGFFTPAELAGGRGLPGGGLLDEAQPAHVDPLLARGDRPMPSNLSQAALAALRAGDLNRAFGGFVASDLKNPLTIPGGRLALIDRVVKMEKNGGRYGAGFIRAEMDIDPGAWFLTSHFIGDEVMPGTLMFEGSLHTLRTFLLALGWVGESGEVNWQPVPGLAGGLKCRGQVTAATRTAAYEVHVRRLEFIRPEGGGEPEPAAVAEAVMLADDRPIVEVRNMSLRLAGLTRRAFLEKESPSRTAGRKAPAAAEGAGTELVFDKKKLLALAMGRPSEALGPAYARFDAGDFVARLPRPPYDFIDQATVTRGRPNEVRPGAEILAVYTPPAGSWVFTEAGGAADSLPYAALNETALQPCGFLAAFMGSALPFDGPMRFRNLGGRATVLAPVGPGASIRTTARLTRASRMGEMVIQHYEFSCSSGGRLVYEGLTHFGFFSPQGLAQQTGLRGENPAGGPAGLTPYPRGAAWPSGRWRMVDMVSVDPTGGGAGLGSALGLTAVDPGAWFFEAHFFQDPVWPGSLGLEAFLQTAKVLAWRLFAPDSPADAIKWAAPAPGRTHEWLYRGQVTRDKKEMAVSLQATSLDMETRTLVVDGLLSVDGLPIYKMTDFSATLDTAAAAQPRAVRAKPAASGGPGPDQPQISPDDILSWRRKRDVSQGQLAKLMGVTPIYISLMERGKRNISPLMAEKLAFIFAGGLSAAEEAADSEILARGTLKSRREEKEAAAK